jgi:hypothetical protein
VTNQQEQIHDPGLNIFQRMARVMAEAQYIKKSGRAAEQQGGYTYVRHDEVTAYIRPILLRHGVGLVVSLDSANTDKMISKNRSGEERTVLCSTVVLQISFVNIDLPEDRINFKMPGCGLDYQDKAMGKAISYAFKYGLLKNLAMETGDEDNEKGAIDLAAERVAPAQRATPARTGTKPGQELKKIVAAWSGCPGEDVGNNVRRVFAKLGLPTDPDKVGKEHIEAATLWCRGHIKEGTEFPDAVAIQVG